MTNSPNLLISEDALFDWLHLPKSDGKLKKRKQAITLLAGIGINPLLGHKGVICVTALELARVKIAETEQPDIGF